MALLPREPIVTRQLRLEPASVDHLDALWDSIVASLPELRPWMAWAPQATRDAAAAYLEESEREWRIDRGFSFVAFERGSDAPLVASISVSVPLPLRRTGEIGYWVRSDHTGRGYATEAAGAMIAFGFDRVGLHRLEIMAGVENAPSNRIIEKLGFTPEGIKRHAAWGDDPYDVYTYAMLAGDPRPEGTEAGRSSAGATSSASGAEAGSG